MNDVRSLSTFRQAIGLVVFIAICFAAASIGSLVTTPQIPGWYAELAKPTWNPPNWIFGPVWSCLYLMMAVAAWLVWRHAGFAGARGPLTLFAIQLALNSLWSVLFFGIQNPAAAAVEIILLWATILATLIAFWNRSKWAGGLLVPYLAWVSFAAVLNFTIWRLNTG
jgi:benzodiazapine receptor